MPSELYSLVLRHFADRLGLGKIHSQITLPTQPSRRPLISQAVFFDHVTIDQDQYASLRRHQSRADSTVAISVGVGRHWVGELQDIFLLDQPSTGRAMFGRVRWFSPVDSENALWRQLYVLQISQPWSKTNQSVTLIACLPRFSYGIVAATSSPTKTVLQH